jgi:hypothetical protein
VSLATALEQAAAALPQEADAIRPANGDPERLLAALPREGAARVAAWLLRNEPEAGGELLDAWVEREGGLDVVLAIPEEPLPKAGRKVLRRVRHQLKSRGVRIEEPAPQPTVARLPKVEDSLEAALVTAPDPMGACLAYLVEPHPTGGARLLEIAFAEGRGILSVEVYAAGRSKLRAFLKELTGRRGLAAVEAPKEAVAALLHRVAAAQPEDRPLPPGWRDWSGARREVAPDAKTPGEIARDTLGDPADPVDLEPVLALVREGRLGPWPAREVLERTAKRIQEMADSPLIVAGARRREQFDELLREGAEEAFGGAAGARIAALLRHAAYVFHERGEEEPARACLAGAAAFERRPFAENPIALALFERPLTGFLEQLERREGEDAARSSLLVTPDAGAGRIR